MQPATTTANAMPAAKAARAAGTTVLCARPRPQVACSSTVFSSQPSRGRRYVWTASYRSGETRHPSAENAPEAQHGFFAVPKVIE